jgi:hypothetical protein
VISIDSAELLQHMRVQGYALVSQALLAELAGCEAADLVALTPGWNHLAPDQFLKDGGRYRLRRHSSYVVGRTVEKVPHRAHWQPVDYNALHGGMLRWFEPVLPAMDTVPSWAGLLKGLARMCSVLKPAVQTWYVEAHPFRIDTTGGIGRPTPEGAHRDGVDFVAVVLVQRHQIKGGETRVFSAGEGDGLDRPLMGQRFTLTEPWSLLLLDDERVIHETTPIQPAGEHGWRDTLVITLRADGFQDPPAA